MLLICRVPLEHHRAARVHHKNRAFYLEVKRVHVESLLEGAPQLIGDLLVANEVVQHMALYLSGETAHRQLPILGLLAKVAP